MTNSDMPQAFDHCYDREWIPYSDEGVALLFQLFRASGGVARAEEVAAYCTRSGELGLGVLARRIAHKQVVSFEWRADIWLPLFQFQFQFQLSDLSTLPGLMPVLAILNNIYNRWELAQWFVQPQAELSHRSPDVVLAREPGAVLRAAQREEVRLDEALPHLRPVQLS